MRIALADDSGIIREAIARMLGDIGWQVAISVGDGKELLAAMAADRSVDVAIVDVAMPPTRTHEGVHAAREIKKQFPGVGVLLLSAYAATPQAIDLLRDIDEGVGYLRKDEVANVDELRGAVIRVAGGGLVVDSAIVRRLLKAPARGAALSRLTGQERDVLRLMAEGFSNFGIASRMHLAERTVEDHVGRVFTKLELSDGENRSGNKRVLAVLKWLRLTGNAD